MLRRHLKRRPGKYSVAFVATMYALTSISGKLLAALSYASSGASIAQRQLLKIEFVERTPRAVAVPARASDQYRFRTIGRGTAIIAFTLNSPVYPGIVYVDTVNVR